ncbi:protein kinase [Lentzea sp. NPDC005914]|uniref:protein kinase domain-containing protein n=1 Tax=Lentzea sp. NPDC005914 TaxID=3154572 RepID=UPI0033C9DEA0
MTAPQAVDTSRNVTVVDPGRGRAGGAAGELADAETALDPGRRRPRDEPVTVLDPGRTRLTSGLGRPLPPGLEARFEVLEDLTGEEAQQGHVYLVRDRDSGDQRVLKVHHGGPGLDGHTAQFLQQRTSRHVVALYETGIEDGRPYEVMEHLLGGTVARWREQRESGVDGPVLTELVRQVAEGLTALHGAQVVHRDIKPSNLLIRALEPLDVVIGDLGVSCHVPTGLMHVEETETLVGTMRYMAPEYLGGRTVTPAIDWWALGVTVLELVTGEPLYKGMSAQNMRSYIPRRPVTVTGVEDGRIALLCQGLLTYDDDSRWGAREVAAWLGGESPQVAANPAPTASAQAVRNPYVFLSEEYYERDLLAAVMTRQWNVSRELLYGKGSGTRRGELTAWLEQFPGSSAQQTRAGRRETDDARLLHLLRHIDPTHPPVYRERNITHSRLPELAAQAMEDDGPEREIVSELWAGDLLLLLATGSGSDGLGGGDGLPGVQTRWHAEFERLTVLARAVPDLGARHEIHLILRERREYALALALLAATANEPTRRRIAAELGSGQALRLPWYADLANRPEHEWLALALIPYATREVHRIESEQAARRAREEWLRRTAWHRESSRRLNRPMALGYAAAGAAVVAVGLFALVAVADVAWMATDAQIVDTWLATVVALAVTLTAESLLAWDASDRFHPAYSLLGAGRIVLGRVARQLIIRGIAVPVVLVALAILAALTVFQPVFTPFVLAALVVVWTVQRYLAWRAQEQRERDIVNQG